MRKRDILLIVGLAVLAFVLLFLIGEWLEEEMEQPETRAEYHLNGLENALEFNGKTYLPKDNLTTILFIGVDKDSEETITGFRNGGQADFLRLLIIDHSAKTVSQLAIDRDTMTPIYILGVMGNRTGIRTLQISLSHSFGDGKAQSCELTVEAVSNLLYSAKIDAYVALNMDGICALNDAVGGVTVTLEDDFSAMDPSMTPGTTLTLHGQQAEIFVRSRRNMSVGTNEARMARQQKYITSLLEMMQAQVRKSYETVSALYDTMDTYLVTNLTKAKLVSEAWEARNYTHAPVWELDGTHIIGSEGFMEFHVDETALQEAVLQLFWQEVK